MNDHTSQHLGECAKVVRNECEINWSCNTAKKKRVDVPEWLLPSRSAPRTAPSSLPQKTNTLMVSNGRRDNIKKSRHKFTSCLPVCCAHIAGGIATVDLRLSEKKNQFPRLDL